MRGSGLSALAASAAVRLYARSVEIEIEVEDMMADGDHMTTEELSAWSDRLLHDDDFDLEAEERKTKTAILAKHPEYQYQYVLGKQLRLGPDDINPLDVDFDQEWESADDPHIEVWKRAVQLRASPVSRALRLALLVAAPRAVEAWSPRPRRMPRPSLPVRL